MCFTDVNVAFTQAARNVLFHDETLLQRFRLTVKASPKPQKSKFMESSSTKSSVSLSVFIMWWIHWVELKSLEALDQETCLLASSKNDRKRQKKKDKWNICLNYAKFAMKRKKKKGEKKRKKILNTFTNAFNHFAEQ